MVWGQYATGVVPALALLKKKKAAMPRRTPKIRNPKSAATGQYRF